MQKRNISFAIIFITCFLFWVNTNAQRQMEPLARGVIGMRSSEKQVFLSWRLLGTESRKTAFNVYRKTGSGSPVKLNTLPLTTVTYYIDSLADLSAVNSWLVKPVLDGKEVGTGAGEYTLPANAPVRQYLSIPLQPPPPAEVEHQSFTYSANDASVGDLDGD